MQVFDDQHRQRAALGRQRLQVGHESGQGLVAQAARVQAAHVRAVTEVKARQLADQLGLAFAAFFKPRAQALNHLAARHIGAVGVGHRKLRRQQAAQQAPGAQRAVGLRAHRQQAVAWRVGGLCDRPCGCLCCRLCRRLCCCLRCCQRGHQLAQQPALAQAGFAHQRQALQLPGLSGQRHGVQQPLQLGLPAHHRCAQALQPALDAREAAVQRGMHQVGQHRRIHALDQQRRLHLQIKQPAHLAPGVVADAQRAGRCRLLHARGDVHGHTDGGLVGLDACAQRHVSGVHAHPHRKVGHAVQAQRGFGLLAPGRQNRQAGANGSLCIVFARFIHAERGLDAVARELEHPALVGLDEGGHAQQRAAEHVQRLFCIEALGHGGGADDIGKHHRHLAALQAGRPQHAGQPGAQRGRGHIDDRVTQRAALAFQRRDGGLAVFDVLGVHGVAASRVVGCAWVCLGVLA